MRVFEGFQKGVNLGGWISQCVSYEKEHFETFITKSDIERIASWGLDHVRLPIDYDIIVEDNGAWKEEGFHYIDNCLLWAKENGLNVILDIHKTKGYMFDPLEVANGDLFFQKTELQDFFVALWEEMARRYGQYKDYVAFELLNEVVNPAVDKIWNGIAKRTIEAIREIVPDVYILVGGVCYNSVSCVSRLDDPYDDKIVYNFHCYEPLVFTHQAAYWVVDMPADFHTDYPKSVGDYCEVGKNIPQASCGALFDIGVKPDDKGIVVFEKLFADAVAFAEKKNVPLYCGEYGVIDQAPIEDTVRWFEDIHATFEKYGIGRAVWNYKQKDFGIVDPHYEEILDEVVKNL